jgi:hypothetical protein
VSTSRTSTRLRGSATCHTSSSRQRV